MASSRTTSENKHLENLTSARWVHIDGSVTTKQTVRNQAGRLLRVMLNTNGATITLFNGTEVIGIIASDSPEGEFPYGIFCGTNIAYQCSGAVDATLAFSD